MSPSFDFLALTLLFSKYWTGCRVGKACDEVGRERWHPARVYMRSRATVLCQISFYPGSYVWIRARVDRFANAVNSRWNPCESDFGMGCLSLRNTSAAGRLRSSALTRLNPLFSVDELFINQPTHLLHKTAAMAAKFSGIRLFDQFRTTQRISLF